MTGLLCSAIGGGFIGGAFDIYSQYSRMHPTSFGQFWNCFNWSEFGISVGAGALAGMAGYVGFGFVTSFFGTGFLATLAAGAFSGVLAGQYGRFGQLLFSGNMSQAGNVLLRPGDMAYDAFSGAAFAGVSYGLGYLYDLNTQNVEYSRDVPNPNGRLGGPEHQAEIFKIRSDIMEQGLTPKTEFRIATPGGTKFNRYIDIAALDQNNSPVTFYQVGRGTRFGLPVSRELQAIIEIKQFGMYDLPITYMIPLQKRSDKIGQNLI